jgi:hypothetical protein
MRRILFTIEKKGKTGYSWTQFVTLLNEIFGVQGWELEPGYSTKLLLTIFRESDVATENYVSLVESAVRYDIIENSYTYEELT